MAKLDEKYLFASSTFNVAQEWVSWAKGQSLQGLQLALGLGLRERDPRGLHYKGAAERRGRLEKRGIPLKTSFRASLKSLVSDLPLLYC